MRARPGWADPGGRRGFVSARVAGAAACTAAVCALTLPAAASAAVTCLFDGGVPPTLEVHVTAGFASTVVRNGSNIEVQDSNGAVACTNGPATVTNTDVVLVLDESAPAFDTQGELDLGGGPFVPGAFDEPGDPTDEIEFGIQGMETFLVRGTLNADNLRLGAGPTGTGAMNLNPAQELGGMFFPEPDKDLDFSGLERMAVTGDDGEDTLNAAGGSDTGDPFPIPTSMTGHGDDDHLTGGSAGDGLQGSEGNDDLVGGAGDDGLGGLGGDDVLVGGTGLDSANYLNSLAGVSVDLRTTAPQNTVGDGTDTLSGLESIGGSTHADTLTGDDGPNALSGAGGNDTLDGRGSVDVLSGDRSSPGGPVVGVGADVLLARDGGPDALECGPLTDSVTADPPGVDTIAADCESVDLLDIVFDFSLVAKARQRSAKKNALAATATCPLEACTVSGSGQIVVPRARKSKSSKLPFESVSAALPAGLPQKLVLTLRKKRLRRVRAALDNRKSLKATFTASAQDGAGNQSTVVQKVKVTG